MNPFPQLQSAIASFSIQPWCTTFFGHRPLIDLLNPSWAKQISRQVNAYQT